MASVGPALDVPDGRPNRRFIAVATLVAVAVILSVSALLIGVWLVRETVVWLVAAGFLAFSIEPLIRIFTRRGLGRGWSTGLAFLVITGVILFFAIALIPSIVDGAQGLKAAIPGYVDQLQATSASDSLNADQAIQTAGNTAEGASKFFERSGKVLDLVGGLASAGFAVFMIFTFTLYFLVYGRDLVRIGAGLMPEAYRAPFLVAARDIYKLNKGYWYGKFLIGVIAGLTTFVTMKLLGLPYAAPLALFVGITDLIPNIGATLGTIPVVIVGLLEEPWKGVVAGLVLILYQQVENNLIQPFVYGRAVQLHPLIVIVAILIGAALLGVLGALVAIPAAAAVQAVVRDYWRFRQGDRGAGQSAGAQAETG
jgi:predicted PurR-regulated permease PerM